MDPPHTNLWEQQKYSGLCHNWVVHMLGKSGHFYVTVQDCNGHFLGKNSQYKTAMVWSRFTVQDCNFFSRKRGAYKNNHLIKTFHVTFPIIWRLSELVTSKYTFYGFSIDP